MRTAFLFGVAIGLALPASASLAQTPPAVAVDGPWSRATPPGATTGVVYMTLQSPAGDTLVGVSSPASATAEVHEMKMDGAVMQMREVAGGLPLPPGQAVRLQPCGYHVMLMGLKAPLKQGQSVALHLTFGKAPPVDVTAPVAALGATTAPGGATPTRP